MYTKQNQISSERKVGGMKNSILPYLFKKKKPVIELMGCFADRKQKPASLHMHRKRNMQVLRAIEKHSGKNTRVINSPPV